MSANISAARSCESGSGRRFFFPGREEGLGTRVVALRPADSGSQPTSGQRVRSKDGPQSRSRYELAPGWVELTLSSAILSIAGMRALIVTFATLMVFHSLRAEP